jgi:hypothetical protein
VGIDYRLHGRLKGDQTSDWIQFGLMAGTNLRLTRSRSQVSGPSSGLLSPSPGRFMTWV